MKRYLIAVCLLVVSCRSTNEDSDVKGEVVFNANDGIVLENSPTHPNDPIVNIDLNNTKFSMTRINPADGVGDLTASDAFKLCNKLSYAGKSSWRMLSLFEVSVLKTSSLALVSGYSGAIHFFVSKKDRFRELDEIHSKWLTLPNQQKTFSGGLLASTEGFSDMNALKRKRDELEVDSQNGKGMEQESFRTYDITNKSESTSSGVNGLICIRQ